MSYSKPMDVMNLINRSFSSPNNPTVAQVEKFIDDADAMIDGYSGHNWLSNTVKEEYHDSVSYGPQSGIIIVENFPVTEITLVEWWTGQTWETAVEGYPNQYPGQMTYVTYLPVGKILFHKLRVDGPKTVRVTYSWGYSTIPPYVKDLSAAYAALTVLAYLSGPIFASYRLGDMMFTYPKDGPYAVQWDKTMEVVRRIRPQLLRRPLVGTG